jgi:hypothetical protein
MPDIDDDHSSTAAKITLSPVRPAAQLDHLLDAALGDTFPASDPVAELRLSAPAVELLIVSAVGRAPI